MSVQIHDVLEIMDGLNVAVNERSTGNCFCGCDSHKVFVLYQKMVTVADLETA